MDELQRRFRRLDRVATPNLWNEAVGRAAQIELARRPMFNPRMLLLAAGLLTAALAGTMAVGGWLSRPTPLPEAVTYDNGMIAGLECDRLVGIDPVSLEARNLANVAGCEFGGWQRPAWSSDGSRLAYLAWPPREGEMELRVYEPASGESRPVGTCPSYCSGIDISPDGSLLAYGASLDDGPALVVTEVDSGESRSIELWAQPRNPRFSPDGSHVALSLVGGRSGIYLVDIRGWADGHIGAPTLLYGIIDAEELAWSPDGEWIAYRQWGGLGTADDQIPFNGQIGHSGIGIVVARADGSETRVLATGPVDTGPSSPTWSPDSSAVAYVTTPNEGAARERWMLELWTVAIDAGEPTRIYASGCCKEGFGTPDWSPDGEWIVFGLDMPAGPAESGLFLVRPDGSELRHLSDLILDPVWQGIPQD